MEKKEISTYDEHGNLRSCRHATGSGMNEKSTFDEHGNETSCQYTKKEEVK